MMYIYVYYYTIGVNYYHTNIYYYALIPQYTLSYALIPGVAPMKDPFKRGSASKDLQPKSAPE